MNRFRNILLLLITLLILGEAHAQRINSTKYARQFDKALQSYERRDFTGTIRQLNDLIRQDSTLIDVHMLMGDIYADAGEPRKAIASYKKALGIDSLYSPLTWYFIANLQFTEELYEEALYSYYMFLSMHPKNSREIIRSENNISLCNIRMELMKNPVPYHPVNLGSNINSKGNEYVNSITLDEEQLMFTRKGIDPGSNESFFKSMRSGDDWMLATEIGEPVNTPGNEGALCLSPDGMFIYLTCCSRRDSYGSCDLYMSRRSGEKWADPVNLGSELNSTAWDSQPCLASDGRTLYFVSTRRGGFGGSDIWKSTLLDNGYWSIPVNLGETINTSADEMAPFIHPDGRTLYFSSKGHPGMGGADLFLTRLDIHDKWTKPENLGFPLNTKADEINLVINAKGNSAYISSDKTGGYGGTDIYRFELPQSARPAPVSYVHGIVYDKNTSVPLSASFELIDLETSQVVVNSVSDGVKGDFILCLPAGKNYALNVSKEGYLFFSMNFALNDGKNSTEAVKLDVPMQPINIGEAVVLRNIFFDSDSYELKPESLAELNKLRDFLSRNREVKVEISGHTDNTGSDQHNLVLSQNRARSVYDFLVHEGIDASRMTYKGYGKNMPVDTNDTEAGKANNRRTEFKVTGK